MASSAKSNNHETKPESKQSSSNNNNAQQKQKPLTPASSLPTKPSFAKKTSGWAAIAASKSQDPSAASQPSSASQTGSTTPNPVRKLKTQHSSNHTNTNQNQRSNKKSTSPKPTSTQVNSTNIAPIVKSHKPLNQFNSEGVLKLLTERTEELIANYPIQAYKPSGSEWSKLGNKSNRKNEKDVVLTELAKYLK